MALTKEIPGRAPATTPMQMPPTRSRMAVIPKRWDIPAMRFGITSMSAPARDGGRGRRV